MTGTAASMLLVLSLGSAPSTTSQQPEAQQEPPVTLGAPAGFAATDQPTLVWLRAGTALRAQPEIDATILEILDVPAELEVLDSRGDWLQVRHDSLKAWTWPGERSGTAEFGDPLFPTVDPIRDPFRADPVRLERAKTLLGSSTPAGVPAGYLLYTDVDDDQLLAKISVVADQLAALYRDSYGLDPGPARDEAIVLFAREEDYAQYVADDELFPDLDTGGHAGHAIAVIVVGEQSQEDVLSVVIHELVHLLNRRALAPEMPSWLEEGLANHLAYMRVDREGRLEPGRLFGSASTRQEQRRTPEGRTVTVVHVEVTGAVSSLRQLIGSRRRGVAPELSTLVGLSSSEFVSGDWLQASYSESGFLVRFLLDPNGAAHDLDFRGYLDRVSRAPTPNAVAPPEVDWDTLEERFDAWLRRLALSHGLRP